MDTEKLLTVEVQWNKTDQELIIAESNWRVCAVVPYTNLSTFTYV